MERRFTRPLELQPNQLALVYLLATGAFGQVFVPSDRTRDHANLVDELDAELNRSLAKGDTDKAAVAGELEGED